MQKMISATPTNTRSSKTADGMFQEKCLVQLNNIALCISQMAESQAKTNTLLQGVLSLDPNIDFLDNIEKEVDSSYCVEDNDIDRTQTSEEKLDSSPAYSPEQTINSDLAMGNGGQAQQNIDDPVVAAIASFSE